MSVAIVRYNAGNIFSVCTALERLGASYEVTDDAERILSAERVLFPGVGEACSAMRYLRERGLDRVLADVRAPLLGICLGMQLLCDYSEENSTEGLGLIGGRIRRFTLPRKVPHVGWSRVEAFGHPLFQGISSGAYFYFVHSFRADESSASIARCDYEERFAAAIASGSRAGVQFHPEKSGEVGERLLRNFLEWQV
jgi:glutamine amidotransferase